jgi:hypothetical protein
VVKWGARSRARNAQQLQSASCREGWQNEYHIPAPAVTPAICPNCGAAVPPGAAACPQCGSDEQTGWSEDSRYDEADLPDENFDYNEFVKYEFGGAHLKPRGIRWYWWLAALLTAGALLCLWLR